MGNLIYDVNINQNIIRTHLKVGTLFLTKKQIDFKPLYCVFMNNMLIEYTLWIQDKHGDITIPVESYLVSGYITKFGKDYCDSIKNGYHSLQDYYNSIKN